MTAPTITALPPAPSISDPTNFETEADALLGALPAMVTELNALGTYLDGVATAVDADKDAVVDLLATAGFSGTSTTSNAIGTGSKTFTIQTGRSFVPGSPILAAVTASPSTNYMLGIVTAYNSGTGVLTADFTSTLGSGTFTAWTISFGGVRGPTGPAASTGLTDTSSTTAALVAGGRYRLTARITAGTLPASPGVGGDPIRIMTGTDASANYHTFTPNGAETVTVNGTAGSPFYFDAARGEIIELVPIAGGWEMGN